MVFKEELVKFIAAEIGKKVSLEEPPKTDMGDYAFPCFSFAKELRKSPVEIAKEYAEKLGKRGNEFVAEVKAMGPYVNIFLNNTKLAEKVLSKIKAHSYMYGSHPAKEGKIMVEFSQPNPYKGLHIGHLRNTALGESLVRILKFYGHNVVPANLYNDTGTHVAKCMWGWEKFYNYSEDLPGDKGEFLGKIYTESNKKLKDDEKGQEEVKELNRKIEDKDPSVFSAWKKGRDWCVESFNKIYEEMDVHFEVIDYDSDLGNDAKQIVQELKANGVAEIDEGATIVNLKKHNLHVVLLLKSDGTLLYITKDLALAKKRFVKDKIDKLIYVVGADQKTHFMQLFKILELWGFEQAKNCYHLSYEMVDLKGGKMSSREGTVILYSQLRNKMYSKALEEVKKRHSDWTKKQIEKSALNITMAAMKFTMLNQDNNKKIEFDMEKALQFEGDTGPYLQYTHARINSILKKNENELPLEINYSLFKEKVEHQLIKMLATLPNAVEDAARNYRPPVMTYYLLDLARVFNLFYQECPVLKASPKLKEARLVLIDSVKQVLANGLKLLAIPAPEQM